MSAVGSDRVVRAPRGTQLSCKGWQQEAALRMLMNNLDPEVAERPQDLVVYGGAGKAARNWQAFDAIVATLKRLGTTRPCSCSRASRSACSSTHEWAPRVLIANANLVGDWDNWDEFRRLDALGLTMYGQMTAGSWIYIGTQGILQGTYQTFAVGRRDPLRRGSDLAGRLVLTAGLGGMGGAQPLAVTMAGGVALCVEVDPVRIARRLETGYVDSSTESLDEALRWAAAACNARQPLSIGLLGNAADVYPELVRRGVTPDLVTDQTSAHDTLNGYVPNAMSLDEARELRRSDPAEYTRRAVASIVVHVEAMVALQKAGSHVFDYGNNIRGEAKAAGFADAFAFQGFVPLYIRPLFCRGNGPFRWAALSGDPADIAAPTAPCWRPSPTTRWSPAGSAWPPRRSTSRACPAASAGSSTASAPRWARSSITRRRRRGQGADRDRPRPPRLGLGGLALSRDRSDARRLRRDRRLAHPERPAEHRRRRLVGELPQRRRRGHRQEPARRHGGGGRRHRR